VALREGQPLTFTAAVDTVPPFDPGDLSTITLRQTSAVVDDDAIDKALEQLRNRGAKFEPVDGRPVADGDAVVVDLERRSGDEAPDRREGLTLELGEPGHPPGFDAELIGLDIGQEKTFTLPMRQSDAGESQGTSEGSATFTVSLKEIRRKVLPELDDEFAKDLGEFESLDALRERVRTDLTSEREETARRQIRNDLLKQLAERVSFDVPDVLVEREMDRRLEEFVRQLVHQNIDPDKADLDWAQMREAQRDASRAAVASTLVLDEIARREHLTVETEDVDKEIEQFAARARRTPAAIRAQLEKEGGIGRLAAGLRREKAVDLALSRAKMTDI
jgi:trigger factor